MSLVDLGKEIRVETFRVAVTAVERQPVALMDAWNITLQMDAAI